MNEINLKSSTIEKSLDLLKDMMSKVLGPTFNELGELWSDNIKMWRLNNQLKNLEKVKQIIEKHNINIKQVNVKVLLPYLDGVSLEEDETLQDMWANLFANYIDSSKNLVSNVYPIILSQLSTKEVEILIQLKLLLWDRELDKRRKHHTPHHKIIDVANLLRLGLIMNREQLLVNEVPKEPDENDTVEKDHSKWGFFYLTHFGYDFVTACSPR